MSDVPQEPGVNKPLQDREFGRIQSPVDKRDWELEDFLPLKLEFKIPPKKGWEFPLDPLDQKDTSHCVGFGMAHFGINLPTLTVYTEEDAHGFYYKCKEVDGNPYSEEGTTIRSAAKVLQDIGAINNYAFARDLDSIRTWVLTRGPVIMGTVWTEGMMKPNDQGILDISGFVLGGHAFIVNEWDIKPGYVTIMNSWGPNWGINGKAYISIKDFEFLFSYGGEALAAVELENYKAKKEGWLIKLINKIIIALKKWFEESSDVHPALL